MKQSTPFHLLFFAAYPVLALYARNSGQVEVVDAVKYAAVIVTAAMLLAALVYAIVRSVTRAALITTGGVLVVFGYVPAHAALEMITRARMSHKLTLTLALVGLGCVVAWAARTRAREALANLTTILNVTSTVLLVAALAISAGAWPSDSGSRTDASPTSRTIDVSAVDSRPDVYHIVLDRYASNEVLKEHYGFDNRAFLDFLKAQGFHVPPRSTANYLKTAMSIASTLNGEHLTSLGKAGQPSSAWRPVYHRIENSRVPALFKDLGYRYVHVGSWWKPTSSDHRADRNENYFSVDEFGQVLLETSVAPIVIRRLRDLAPGLFPAVDLAQEQREAAAYAFDAVRRAAREEGPTYVFAHILMPHPPRLMDTAFEVTHHADYVERVAFVNTQLEKLVIELLRAPTKPVILIQSDEGVFPSRYQEADPDFNWKTASKAEMRVKFGILNAMYLPGVPEAAVHPTITLVNTYPLVFSTIFKQRFPFLPDRNVAFVNEVGHLYDFFDVTDTVGAVSALVN